LKIGLRVANRVRRFDRSSSVTERSLCSVEPKTERFRAPNVSGLTDN
jgi:hypothetical protein